MILFKDLIINTKGNKLIIEAEITPEPKFLECYFKKIYIDTEDSFLTNGPSSNTVYERNISLDDIPNDETNSTININGVEKPKKISITINNEDIQDADLKNNLLIVYLEADGIIDNEENIDCCDNNNIKGGCVIWLKPLYNKLISLSREIINTCELPKEAANIYIIYEALQVSVRTGNILEAIKIYKKFFKNNFKHINSNNCCGR